MTRRRQALAIEGSAPGRTLSRPAMRAVEPTRFLRLDASNAAGERVEWAPLQLARGARTRAVSPRAPQAVLLHLAAQARAESGTEVNLADVDLRPDLARLSAFVDAAPNVVARMLDGFLASGALVSGESRPAVVSPPATVRLAPGLGGPAPRCAGLHWGRIAVATSGAPSAWVTAHVLAERLAPEEWAPVPRSALEDALSCGTSGLRGALDRLVTGGLLERREQRGGVSLYRFGAGAWGRGETAVEAMDSRPPAPLRTTAARGATSNPTPKTDAGVVLRVGGVDLEVPSGMRARVEIGEDGRPRIVLG